MVLFFFSSRRRHTRLTCDWSSDVCSSDLQFGEISLSDKPAKAPAGKPPAGKPQPSKEELADFSMSKAGDLDLGSLGGARSEERRVGKECRCRWGAYDEKKSA